MIRLLVTAVCAAAIGLLSLPFTSTPAWAVTTLALSPSSGDPPDVIGGALTGTGWTCTGVGPGVTVTVTGAGVSGSATIGGSGELTRGSFTIVGGSPGQVVVVTATAATACAVIGTPQYLHASANFTFNAPTPAPTNTRPPTSTPPPATPTPAPTLAPTNTPVPTNTPLAPTNTPAPGVTPPTAAPTVAGTTPSPQPTRPGETPAPTGTSASGDTPTPASQPPPGQRFLLFDGCVPAGQLSLEFVPLYLVGSEQPDPNPTGPGFMLPAVQLNDGSGRLAFASPQVEPGRLFRVTPKSDGGDCEPAPEEPQAYWVSGDSILLHTRLKSDTTLEICLQGDKSPCEYPEVKGAFIHRGDPSSIPEESPATVATSAWGTDQKFYAEDLKKTKQRFRSTTNLGVAGSGKLQASVLPFPKGAEDDPNNVPGLVASWDISCVNCEFTVDMSPLAPPTPPAKKHWYKTVGGAIAKPFKAVGSGITWVASKIGGLVGLGGGGDPSQDNVVQAGKPQLPDSKPSDLLVSGALNPLLQPTTYYFRLLLPLESEPGQNAATNSVRMQQVDKPPPIKIVNPTPTSTPTESPYEVHFTAYHGILPPLNPNKICYVATQDAWPSGPAGFYTLTYTTDKSKATLTGTSADVHKGQLICQPDPKEPNLLEKIVSWAEYVVDWASEAWTDLKDFAVNVVLKYTPLGLQCDLVEKSGAIPKGSCSTAFHMALDAALVTMGIPPDIPNFHELVDQGIDYLAAEAAAQVGIPPEVVKAATDEGGPFAGAALDYAEAQLRAELQKQIKAKLSDAATQIELGYAAAVSWVPDGIPVRPDDYLPPAASIVVTRKQGVPGGDAGCTLNVTDSLTITKASLDNPPAGWEWVNGLPHPLSQLTSYDLFGDEAGQGIDKSLNVPPLAPGESYTVPLTFKPNFYKSGWSPLGLISTTDYIRVWQYLHEVGTLHLKAKGSCGSDGVDVAAKSQVFFVQLLTP